MMSNILIPALTQRFPTLNFTQNSPSAPVVTIPAAHPEVGDVRIYVDGLAVTVEIGSLAHGHFDPYEYDLSEDRSEQRAQDEQRVVEDVVVFLADLFSDQILLWASADGQAGGWKYLDYVRDLPQQEKAFMTGARLYLWSGPIPLPGSPQAT